MLALRWAQVCTPLGGAGSLAWPSQHCGGSAHILCSLEMARSRGTKREVWGTTSTVPLPCGMRE